MKKLIALAILVCSLAVAGYGCESCQRSYKSMTSSVAGLERKVVWTGFDGSRKVWEGRFKLDSNQNSPTVYFITEEGKTVVLGPGWYSVEK
jgi:hypothetical protein